MGNKNLQDAFVQTATSVRDQFKTKYGETWADPTNVEMTLLNESESLTKVPEGMTENKNENMMGGDEIEA